MNWSIHCVKFFQSQVADKENLLEKSAKDINTNEPLVPTVWVSIVVTELFLEWCKKVKLNLVKEKTNMDVVIIEDYKWFIPKTGDRGC